MKFNLGCGKDIREDWINVDKRGLPGVNQIRDLDTADWGLGENCAEEILASDLFEHLNDVVQAMDNCAKLLIPNGWLTIRAPHSTSRNLWLDPTHRRAFELESFDYFDWSTHLGEKYQYGSFDWRVFDRHLEGDNVIIRMRVKK